MKVFELLEQLEKMNIHTIAGVPDSTLKQFCDGLQLYEGNLKHYVTANEGAAVGLAVGSYLATGNPACVYMQNSGIGNIVNPLTSLANIEVYGIPVLFLVGWRGEPGIKDEPQHVFQGRITLQMFDTLEVPYEVIDQKTTFWQLQEILQKAESILKENRQFALVIKKGTFESGDRFVWENGNSMIREEALGKLLAGLSSDAVVVSTTGKISRELYEQSNKIFGNHDRLFMTVGGMGHASMIALGIAEERPDLKVVCVDGDGAVLMHMGALPFIAASAPSNFYHIVINNQAHESVGAMPTGCKEADFAKIAEACGYLSAEKAVSYEAVEAIGRRISESKGPMLIEVPVALHSRADLSRPAESAGENKECFMEHLGSR